MQSLNIVHFAFLAIKLESGDERGNTIFSFLLWSLSVIMLIDSQITYKERGKVMLKEK